MMNSLVSRYGSWTLGCLCLATLVGVLVAEHQLPGPVEQPEQLPQEIAVAAQLFDSGQVVQAKGVLAEIVKREPDLAEAQFQYARVMLATGEIINGVDALRRAIALDPDDARYYVVLGDAYQKIGWYDKAEETFSSLLEKQPSHLVGLLKRADVFYITNRLAQSKEDLDFAVTSSRGDPEALLARAYLFLATGAREAAAADLRAVASGPDEVLAKEARQKMEANGLQ